MDALDRAIRAHWDSIPCHIAYDVYMAEHPQREAIRATQRRCMAAAVAAYNQQEDPMTENQKPKPGPIVEDETLVGGLDATTGAPVIRPKTPEGRADEATKPTDPHEAAQD